MHYIKKYKFIIIIFILLIVSSIIPLFNKKEETIIEETIGLLESNEIEVEEEIVLYKVDVKGAVKNPGVYELDRSSRVIDAVNKAGGLLYYANSSTINLSKQITDEMVIMVYTNDEIAKAQQGTTVVKYIEKECVCPKLENDACITKETETALENSEENNKESENTLININTANLEMLMTIPQIGESKAKAIISYREEKGNFKDISEIKNISGIGDATYEKLKNYITV